jgi:hypothetical protein
MQKLITVGIDPDIVKSGIAVLEGGKLTSLHALPFAEIPDFLLSLGGQICVQVKIENPGAIKTMWSNAGKGGLRVQMSIAQDVGRVMAVAELLRQVLEHAGYQVKMVKPLSGPVKKAKDDAEFFNRLTGWTGRSNQDKRDAALIALYG